MKLKSMSLSTRSAWTAQLFILPFYLGFWFFFLSPLIESFRMSLSEVRVEDGAGYIMEYVGLANYNTAFFEDTNFTTNLLTSLTEIAWKVPVIIVLSLFMALILNQKFSGRVFVRAVFFIPVIFASGVALQMVSADSVASSALTGSVVSSGEINQSTALNDLLVNAGFDAEIIKYATQIANSLFSLVWRSGIQMIIFLAGLQGISPALYEASSIEGATSWENFWKITLPMLAPTILLNLVYTIIDSFTDTTNKVMTQINTLMGNSSNLDLASAFAWTYFALIGIILLIIVIIFNAISKRTS